MEILPDNHYGIFEKTGCPRVSEILQVADFTTGANTPPVYSFIAFSVCFPGTGRLFTHVSSPSQEFIKERQRRGIIKDFSLGAEESLDSSEPERLAKCVSEAFRWQNTWRKTVK